LINSIFNFITSLGVFLLGGIYFVYDDGYRYGGILLALVGLASMRQWQGDKRGLQVLFIALAFPMVSFLGVMWHEGWGSRALMYASVILVLPAYQAVRIWQPEMKWLFQGAAAGALAACLWAFHDVYVLGHERAQGLLNAIKFGNMALFFGLVCLLRASRSWHDRERWHAVSYVMFAALGLLASLLSGTRGGWIALPGLIVLLAIWAWSYFSASRIVFSVSAFLVMFVILAFANPWGVTDRILLAWHEIKTYKPDNLSSVGQRINMWRLAWDMIAERPWLGHGDLAFGDRTQNWQHVIGMTFEGGFKHPHNDFLAAWVKYGVGAPLALLITLIAPLAWFWRQSRRLKVREVPLVGVFLCFCFLIFGQTQTLLGSKSILITYFVWLAVLLAFVDRSISHDDQRPSNRKRM